MAADPINPNGPSQIREEAFDPGMTKEKVDDLLKSEPFNKMDQAKFRSPKKTLPEILFNHTRIVTFNTGEIIVRQGDYGTSAFLIRRGAARIVRQPALPQELLGRQAPGKKGLFRTLAQVWNGGKPPEIFRRGKSGQPAGLGERREADQVHVFLQDIPRIVRGHDTEKMTPGDFFGEIGALSRMPRASTIFADCDGTELLEIRWQGLRDLMKNDDALRKHINEIYRERALATYVREAPLFKNLTKEQKSRVTEGVEFATYGEYDWSGKYKDLVKAGAVLPEQEPVIMGQGDYANGMVIVRAGFARVTRKFGAGERTLKYIGAGQMFGFDEIAHNWRTKEAPVDFQFSLRAIGYTHLLIIPTRLMNELILPSLSKDQLPPLIQPVKDTPEEPAPDDAAREKVGPEVLEFLTAGRYFNGTATMVIDLERCTRCDDCVRACASTHDNNPRFLRHGPSNGRLMIANACMHCADPVCMIGCPTGAIHRESTGQVVINPATCIGCETCYGNCPYEAIRMVEVRDTGGNLFVEKEEDPLFKVKIPEIKMKATKCDLCYENHGGPACQRACPHGALERINLNDLNSLARWLKR